MGRQKFAVVEKELMGRVAAQLCGMVVFDSGQETRSDGGSQWRRSKVWQ